MWEKESDVALLWTFEDCPSGQQKSGIPKAGVVPKILARKVCLGNTCGHGATGLLVAKWLRDHVPLSTWQKILDRQDICHPNSLSTLKIGVDQAGLEAEE